MVLTKSEEDFLKKTIEVVKKKNLLMDKQRAVNAEIDAAVKPVSKAIVDANSVEMDALKAACYAAQTELNLLV